MSRFHEVRVVAVDPAAAAEVVLDWSLDPLWRPAVSRVHADPPGRSVVGQRLVERLRFAGGTFETPTRIVSVTPTSAGFDGGSATVRVHGVRRVEAVAEGSRIEAEVDICFTGWATPLTWLLAPAYRRRHRADLDRLAALLERRPVRVEG